MSVSAVDRILLKVDRAQEHYEALDREIAVFLQEHPPQPLIEHDFVHDCEILRVGGLVPLPPRWGAIAGDIVGNARSALDHLAYQLVLANGRKPGQRTAFPVCTTIGHWYEATKTEKSSPIRGMSPEARDAVQAVQPFSGRTHDEARLSNLAGLHHLWNRDKHRLVHAARAFTAQERAEFTITPGPPMTTVDLIEFPDNVPIEEGAMIGRVRLMAHELSIHTEVELNATIKLTVGFVGEPGDPIGTMHFLTSAIAEVRDLVTNQFAAHL